MSNRPRLAIRADGGPELGVGHLARTLALVQAWHDRGGEAVLVTRSPPPFWSLQFRDEGCDIVDPEESPTDADWWVVDGYALGGRDAAPDAPRLAMIDDHDCSGTAGEGVDLVIDQNLSIDPSRYPSAAALLCGPRYALLRRPDDGAHAPPSGGSGCVVIVFGGAPDPALIDLGAAIESDERLRGRPVRFLRGAESVSVALSDADLAIAAAGSVAWEICRAGVASVLVAVADNQEPVARELERAGAAVRVPLDLDEIVNAAGGLLRDEEARERISGVARDLVDGLGARRVACRLRAGLLRLRDAAVDDAELLYRWRNDPGTRDASFSSEPVPWPDHLRWLQQRLAEERPATFIASDQTGAPVGIVRFDHTADGASEIGVNVAPERRRGGWGGALISAGTARWHAMHPTSSVQARIKESNRGSARAFEDADFDRMPDDLDGLVRRYARCAHDG